LKRWGSGQSFVQWSLSAQHQQVYEKALDQVGVPVAGEAGETGWVATGVVVVVAGGVSPSQA